MKTQKVLTSKDMFLVQLYRGFCYLEHRLTFLKNPKIIIGLLIFCNLFLLSSFAVLVNRLGGIKYMLFKATVGEQLTGMSAGRIDLFNMLDDTPNEIIFLGDSIIQEAEWSELFHNINIKNRGVGSTKAESLMSRLDEILASKPHKIFLMSGINDLISNSAKETTESIQKLIDNILEKSPLTKVYVQSILPVNNDIHQTGISNEDIQHVNTQLEIFCAKKADQVTWIDLTPALSDHQFQLSQEYTYDGMHLNGKAYLKWRDLISPFVWQ